MSAGSQAGDVAVVMAARNEADRIAATVAAAAGLAGVGLVVVVDDGSRDATASPSELLVPVRTVGRIRSRAAFGQLQRSRARAASGPVRAAFVAVPAGEGVFPQVGYAIGRHCGNAVTRNTLRRRARAVVRDVAPDLSRGTYLLRFAPPAVHCGPAELSRCVRQALLRAGA